ncbi:MAG: hypothetical protein LBJ11_06095 [Oscillospiraceae bacterium]|jgi:Mor family transcriptional regulator|nr:hypothetical protein [Oscillospiraceae bacterium]
MKYRNAGEILPDPLLRELQRYAQGEALYIPQAGERKIWGEGSGARRYYAERNDEIRQKFRRGAKIDALAEEYGLSGERVRKIVYEKL